MLAEAVDASIVYLYTQQTHIKNINGRASSSCKVRRTSVFIDDFAFIFLTSSSQFEMMIIAATKRGFDLFHAPSPRRYISLAQFQVALLN